MSPAISVALCCCDGAPFIEEQLRSIAQQTLLPAEVVVVDDASEDGTPERVEALVNQLPFSLRLERNASRLGVVKNFERAIGLCRNTYCALCDQDDIWLPEKLALLAGAIREREATRGCDTPVLVHSGYRYLLQDRREVEPPPFQQSRQARPADRLRRLVLQNFVTGCTALLNRALVTRALPIPGDAVMHDWWLALHAAAAGEIVFVPQATSLYRRHPGTYTRGEREPGLARLVVSGLRSGAALAYLTSDRFAAGALQQADRFLSSSASDNDASRGIRRELEAVRRGGLAQALAFVRRAAPLYAHWYYRYLAAVALYRHYRRPVQC